MRQSKLLLKTQKTSKEFASKIAKLFTKEVFTE